MKYHKPLVAAVVEILNKTFEENYYADRVIEQTLKQNSKWGARDRKFIAETSYEMIRFWRLIYETANQIDPSKTKNYYFLFAIWQTLSNNELPQWEEFSNVDKEKIILVSNKLKQERKYKESYPDWLDNLLKEELGENVWDIESSASNMQANVVLRVNTIKANKEKLKSNFESQDIEIEDLKWNNLDEALVLKKRKNLLSLPEYKNGLFEIQDASSQLISKNLNPQSDSFVIDACAGAGGKSLHLAALMQNKGKIVSMDVEEYKLKELQRRADRAGVSIIKTHQINSKTIDKYKNSADYLLLDVPCSGLGTLKRNPDAKWKLSLDFINKIKNTQQNILNDYSAMLKSGGIMLYATCSILPSENQDQIKSFLTDKKGEFELQNDKKIMPSEGFDGFYLAILKKK